MKVIKVKSCYGCPYRLTNIAYQKYPICEMGHIDIEIEDGSEFPDFCPLKDYKQHPSDIRTHDIDEFYPENS